LRSSVCPRARPDRWGLWTAGDGRSGQRATEDQPGGPQPEADDPVQALAPRGSKRRVSRPDPSAQGVSLLIRPSSKAVAEAGDPLPVPERAAPKA
jgi:hypothetical protein